jgi:hypothetical protein
MWDDELPVGTVGAEAEQALTQRALARGERLLVVGSESTPLVTPAQSAEYGATAAPAAAESLERDSAARVRRERRERARLQR